MKITIFITATHSYLYCIEDTIRRINASIFNAKKRRELETAIVILTDLEGKEILQKKERKETIIALNVKEGGENYQEESQILIARLQQQGIEYAIENNSDLCWSVEADVLVAFNALSCSLDMLEFDDGWYDVAFVTYPSQSGVSFLGGHGTPQNPICEDFLPEEREIPEELLKRIENSKLLPESNEEEINFKKKEFQEVHEEIKKYPPKGNIFELNAKKWRKRGWLDNAYPGIGKGAVLPTDWTGMGCTLMSSKALAAASFDGYTGKGTQDLFLNWRRWHPEDIKMCVITHCVCEHVIRKDGGYTHVFAHHEVQGECKGHLRLQHNDFTTMSNI